MNDPNSREAIARREVGQTAIAPVTVRVLLVAFLAPIAIMPLVEWSAAGASIAAPIAPAVTADADTLWRRIVSGNRVALARLQAFERGLEDRSLVGQALRPRAQAAMVRRFGAGNERVYPGRDGWLFYRPDVEYVTGQPFLDPARLARRVEAAEEWTRPPQPDPREAIVRFNDDLARRGITLVVVPTPAKPSVHPEMLTSRAASADGPLQNASYSEFRGDLARQGVLVFDPAEALVGGGRTDAQYLATDTHWRPEAMEMVAGRLAAFVAEHVRLPPVDAADYRLERVEVRNRGDTARMLDLPPDSNLYPPESVWLRRILLPDGLLWRSSRAADVLVLGDSFSNIYALESMGWGTSAGFVEQLSYILRRPIDRLVQNDEGAIATRAMLYQDPSRLDGKRLVVYQFAARELAFGDWRVVP